MTLDAARAAALSLAAVEAGQSAVTLVVVGGGADVGARMVVTVDGLGAETVHGRVPGTTEEALGLVRASLGDPKHRDGLKVLADGTEIYLEVRPPIQDLVIVGAGHIARPMARVGADLGFRVWVLDDRPDFATRERFPEAYKVLRADFSDPFRDVPIHRGTHMLLVTRGHRYDYDCLVRVLGGNPMPSYIGMIGSRRRVRATFVQLVEDGIPRERLLDIQAPVGLDIGAETPEEIAVSVAAELVRVRRGGTGLPLRDVERVAERFFQPDPTGDP